MIDIEQANTFLHEKKYAEALEIFYEFLKENADNHVVHGKIASCLVGLNDYEKALDHIKWGIANGPGNGDLHYIAGAVLSGLNDLDGAMRETDLALSLCPMHPSALWNKALYSFAKKKYNDGFKYYAYGKITDARPIRNLLPTGEPGHWKGKSILVWCEQGHGDIFMLSRYLHVLREEYKPREIILEVYPELLPIFFNHPDCDIVYRRPDNGYLPYSHIDYSVSLWDIPIIMQGEGHEPLQYKPMPSDVVLTPELLSGVKEYFDSLAVKEFKIGVCWKGNSSHANDVNRSATFNEFVKPLLDVKGVKLFLFQQGEEIPNTDKIHNLGMELSDWAITGSYLTQMDLIITVDTALAHLAGVLGIPTWVICPFANEWRWGHQSDPCIQGWSCDWYNSIRIYRQTIRKDWSSIMPRVVTDLEKEISCHKTTPLGQPLLRLSSS